ncbi:alpha/beta fold hydrolase [Pseudoalteromonas sp. T1lg65]|uniref:alpha/beta fold hydrolase n=1 Tax=Pseudoalteromonas sp. T1lg65 TaxID=2077101 RepID=UPI003F7AB2B0
MKLFWLLIGICLTGSAHAASTFIKIKNYRVEYQIAGSGKHTILLEAGGSAGLSDWDPIFDSLLKHARVIRYSRIGNGNSAPIKKNYSSEEYAEEANMLLDLLHIVKPVVYIAHSYGANIARHFAANYPEKVSALMLIEPASEHDVEIMRQIDLAKAEAEIARIKLDDLANGMSNQYLDFWSKRPLPDYPQIADIPVTVIASVKQYSNPPVLFFTDQGRALWGELHTKWAESFPQGKVVLTKQSYHFPQRDEPEMVVKEIIALLNRTKG